jgi:hypothetical protein
LQWARATDRAQVYLLSELSTEVAEELFTTPLESPTQVQKLLRNGGTCVLLDDAHKTMAATPSLNSL